MSKGQQLYEAVRKGSMEAVENFLTEPGLEVNKMYEDGQETLLSAAVRKGSVGLVDLLIDNGANVDTATPTKSPLHVACYAGDLRVAKCLVGHNADLDAVDETNRTALQWALKGGHPEIFKYLREQKASLGSVAADGNTLLHDAIPKCSSECINELLEDCAEIDTKNDAGETLLFLAAGAGKVDIMQKLIARGADVYTMSKNAETLLHVASRNGHVNVAQFLIEEYGVNEDYVNQQTGDDCFATINKIKTAVESWSALHFACAFGHTEVVRYLLVNGAKKRQRTRDGLRPVEICKAFRQKHLVPIFEERRASEVPHEMPTEEQLRMRRKTMPANHVHGKAEWKNVF